MVATEVNDNQTKMLLRVEDEHFVYHGLGDQLELRRLEYQYQNDSTVGPFNWYNKEIPLDTNGDGVVSPIDALVVINAINDGLVGVLPTGYVVNQIGPIVDQYMIDTNGDGHVSPIDALRVIEHINATLIHSVIPTAESEAVDAVFASAFFIDHADNLDDDDDK